MTALPATVAGTDRTGNIGLSAGIDAGGNKFLGQTLLDAAGNALVPAGQPYVPTQDAAAGATLTAILAKLGNTVLAAGSAVIGKFGIQIGGADVGTANPMPVSVVNPATNAATSTLQQAILTALEGVISVAQQIGGAPVSPSNAMPMYDAYQAPIAEVLNSSAALNTALTINTQGYDTVIFTIAPQGTITQGTIAFEISDGSNWLPVKAPRTDSYQTDTSFSLTTGSAHSWQVPVAGYPSVRARLSTVIMGSGTAQIIGIASSAPDVSLVTVGLDPNQPLPGGTNTLGSVGIQVASAPVDSTNPVPVQQALPSNIISGQATANTNAAALPGAPMATGAVLTALSTNSATIFVGPAGVTTANGYPLAPGQSISYAVNNLDAIYFIGTNTSDKLAYTGN